MFKPFGAGGSPLGVKVPRSSPEGIAWRRHAVNCSPRTVGALLSHRFGLDDLLCTPWRSVGRERLTYGDSCAKCR
eukprot:8222416-Alexandrium_andersonii.AAC.1